MAMSEARIRANRKWNENNLDRINLTVPKGQKAIIKAAADAAGESLNAWIKTAIDERLQKEKQS